MRSKVTLGRSVLAFVFVATAVAFTQPLVSRVEGGKQEFSTDHFMCYELRRQPRFAGRSGDSLADQFGPSTVDVRDRKRLCNPADKNDEGILHPSEHLVAYTIRQTAPDFDTIRDIRLVNQFGEIEVDLARPDYLMVPSLKFHLMMERGPAPFTTDHFKCYDLRRGRTRTTVNVTDQFGDLVVNVKRPERLCVPADKNGGGIQHPADHLTCYRVKTDPRRLASGTPFLIDNQFEQETVIVTGPRELCVPSLKFLPDSQPTPTETPRPTATETPVPSPSASPGCGFINTDEEPGGTRYGPAVGVCGGPCPTDQLCLFNSGECRCTSVTEACQFVPPQTTTQLGMCLGFCADSTHFCMPVIGAFPQCECGTPS